MSALPKSSAPLRVAKGASQSRSVAANDGRGFAVCCRRRDGGPVARRWHKVFAHGLVALRAGLRGRARRLATGYRPVFDRSQVRGFVFAAPTARSADALAAALAAPGFFYSACGPP